MKNFIRSIVLLTFLLNCTTVTSQDLTQDQKIWYSTYLFFKINKKMYVDDYLLNGYDANKHTFSFIQNDLTFHYKLKKNFSAYVGFANYFYKWNSSYNRSYSGSISKLGTMSFFRGSLGLKYKFTFLKKFEMDQTLGFQAYYPSLDKYQSRIIYNNQISFSHKKLPLNLTPYAQIGLFYYLNGRPTLYYNDEGDFEGYYSPNGLHRVRYKFGIKFKPIKGNTKFGVSLYYSIQKEFNTDILGGHALNASRRTNMETQQEIDNPFNNYNILGIQLNFILSKTNVSSTTTTF
jgi:hypothetical protein